MTSYLGSERLSKGGEMWHLELPCLVLAGTYRGRAVQAKGLSTNLGSMAAE